jgi:hypothetical protein
MTALTIAWWLTLGQVALQGYRAFMDLQKPLANGMVASEHLWAFLTLAIIFCCLSSAARSH